MRLWEASSVEVLVVLHGHDGPVSSVAFSPDGSRLSSVGFDGVVRVWALNLDELVAIAEREVTRDLTDEECRQYRTWRAVSDARSGSAGPKRSPLGLLPAPVFVVAAEQERELVGHGPQ